MLVEGWKLADRSLVYSVQFNDINLKTKDKVLRTMQHWNITAEVVSSTSNNFGLVFTRTFFNKEEFDNWFKTFPYSISIYSPKDELAKKKVIREKKEKVKKERKRRSCKLCGASGHIAKTCKIGKAS